MSPKAEDYRTVARRLQDERNMTVEDLAYTAWQQGGRRPGASLSVIQKRLAPKNTSPPSVAVLEAIAAGLGVEPDVFNEYRLAQARNLFDETEIGLDEALANLSAFRAALRVAEEESA